MIIERKYEWLGILYENDPEAKKLIDEAFELSSLPENEKRRIFEYNRYNISAFMNIGCGIPGKTYAHFMAEFEALDKNCPYDNGLTFNDVTDIEFEASGNGTAIQMRYISRIYDLPYRIVGFGAIENKNGRLKINKGWIMTPPFEIG